MNSRRGEPVQGVTAAGDKLAYDLGVDDRRSGGDAGDGVGELLDVADAFLEEVARSGTVAAVVEEFLGEGLLDVLAEDENREPRLLGLEQAGRAQALVRLAGRHTDVGDHQVSGRCSRAAASRAGPSIAGLAATGVGAACSVGMSFAGADGMVLLALATAMSLTAGLTLLVPALVAPVIGALTRPLTRRPGATALLVRENMITAVRRTSATVAPVLATVAFAVLITSAVQTTQSADTTRQTAAVRAEAAVVPRGTPGLSDATVARVGGTALVSTTVYGGDGRTALFAAGVSPGVRRVLTVPPPRPVTAVVTAAVAAAHGWREGQVAAVTFEDGRTRRLRVTAVVDDSLPYQVFLPRDLVRAHDLSALADVAFRTGPAPTPRPRTTPRRTGWSGSSP